MSIIIFLIVLFILILVHEWGHFIMAKKTNMRVDEFGIGFPPKLFGIKKGETEYTFNALPIGGFVKIWGENYEEEFSPVESEASDRRSETSVEAGEGGTKVVELGTRAEGKADKGELEDTSDASRAFSNRPKWAQAVVLVAGVAMNVIFAWFLFSLTFMIGVHTVVDEDFASDSAELYVSAILPDSPASVMPAGSIIESITTEEGVFNEPTPSEFSTIVSENGDRPVDVSYRFDDTSETVTLVPVKGLIENDPERYIIGTSLLFVDLEKQGFFEAIVSGFNTTWQGLLGITLGLWSLITEAIVGQADFSQVAGPVGIVDMVGDAASFGLASLLTFTAFISLNLAIINLLPFPALDGGRLVFVGIEAVTRRKIPPEWAGRINLVGFAILMLLMIAVTYNDILRLL